MRLLAPCSDAGDPVGAETGGGRPTTSLNAALASHPGAVAWLAKLAASLLRSQLSSGK
jgi:hypothetical protein